MRLYFILLALLIISCKTTYDKESYSNTEREKITYSMPFENVLEVDNICDTLKTSPKVSQMIHTGSGDVEVKLEDNKLRIEVKSDTVYKEKIVYKDKEVVKEKKVTKFKWAKITWFFLATIMIFLIFPKIALIINGLFRSLIFLLFKIPI